MPWSATAQDHDEAAEVAAEVVGQLPVGAADFRIRNAITRAIAPVPARIDSREEARNAEIAARNAERARQQQINSRQSPINDIVAMVPVGLPGGTHEEWQTAKPQVRAALEQLPITASGRELATALERELDPLSGP